MRINYAKHVKDDYHSLEVEGTLEEITQVVTNVTVSVFESLFAGEDSPWVKLWKMMGFPNE